MAHLSIPLRARHTPWWRSYWRDAVSNVRTVTWLVRRILRQAKLR
jgi:hypothetical protein